MNKMMWKKDDRDADYRGQRNYEGNGNGGKGINP
jgi:hypothetical protein